MYSPKKIPDHINNQSSFFLELFHNAEFWRFLCRQTNLRAHQVKQPHFILCQEFQACRCQQAEGIPLPEVSDGEVCDQAGVLIK